MTKLKTIGILNVFALTIAMISSPLAFRAFAQSATYKTVMKEMTKQTNAEKNTSEPTFVLHKTNPRQMLKTQMK